MRKKSLKWNLIILNWVETASGLKNTEMKIKMEYNKKKIKKSEWIKMR